MIRSLKIRAARSGSDHGGLPQAPIDCLRPETEAGVVNRRARFYQQSAEVTTDGRMSK
jgi:hypothetical protein